ncbi:macrolide transporter subunit MacA [Xenorhabdus griffiniae]|uniref:Macrolide transporter subunit MacA n=1 Tax=Xenorhabdus griffiniae TaxID=351672 RepID=A0ABY9XDS2_9GAMM|nr:macrolide transporter subunit MacA [Xenorhabdus griffiniae]MBD1226535.1 macrolide transporter subunit MacA [Xenorhabdus griffiniae]MBE8587231.1 macrolide transporter subunit MacA [Xenorhabdus griffiniae]WMV71069.1 macrolide transporter subunit MacA [Xenorhabdus griffiniae]WNH00745.1 macrolide transporter subunit MacA [Xenorhabdus griffiniae]
MKLLFAKYRWIGAGLVLIAIASVWSYFFYLPKPVSYQTSAVIKGDFQRNVLAVGKLDAVSKVDVGAQVSGQLKELYVKLGDKVKQGQLLALIDPQTAKNTVAEIQETAKSLEANLRGARAELKLAQLKVNRLRHLFKLHVISQQELDSNITDMQSKAARIDDLVAQIKQNKAKLDTAKTNLQYTRITAPIEGIVTDIKTFQGQTVIAAQQAPTILTLANLDTMIVNAEVSEADVINLAPGQKVSFTILGAPGRQFHSVLKDTLPTPQVENNAIFYYARFEVPNPEHILRLQMTAQVKIALQSLHNVLMIPISALEIASRQYASSTQHVLSTQYEVSVLHNGKAEKRKITIGAFDNANVQVLSGLKENERVITSRSDSSVEE